MPPTAREHALTGMWTLIRLILRRDRIRIPAWILVLTVSVVGTAASLPDVYLTEADRQSRAALMANPAAAAFAGPGHGLGDYTYGAMMTQEMLGFTAIFVALMSLLLVVRHTRTEEETGRAELVRATVVGRHATSVAALLVVGATNVVLGALVAAGLASSDIESITWEGSLLFGAALASVGLVFAGVAAVTAQLSPYGRGAAGLAGALLGVAYVLRAAGDMGDGTLSWLSPIGWVQATAAYVDDVWWPLLLAVALAAVLVVVALQLSARRDLGAGLVPPRPGPPEASEALGSPLGLALRLQRASLIGWSLSLLVFGLGYGTLVSEIETFIADNPQLQEVFAAVEGADLTEAFLGTIVSLMAMVAAVYAILATLRLRGEESSGRAEPVLSTAVSRSRWLASHLAIATVGAVIVVLLGALGLGISAAATTEESGLVAQLVGAALVQVPVLWLIVGLAVALFGVVPRAIGLAWALVVYALFIGMLSGLLGLPEWMANISPFALVPLLPAEDFTVAPVAGMAAAAVVLVVIGLVGFRRRDLASTT